MASVLPPTPPLRALLTHQGYWRWSASAQLQRLPTLMAPLAFVLVGTYASGSHAVGGLMVTVYIISEVCCAPLAGRLLDRLGPAVGIPRVLGLAVVVLSGLAAAVALRAPAPVLFLLVAVAAALAAGAPGAMRALLSQAVPPHLVAPALAVDSTVIELVVVTAPLLVVAAAAPAPPGAIIAMAGATAMAALLAPGPAATGVGVIGAGRRRRIGGDRPAGLVAEPSLRLLDGRRRGVWACRRHGGNRGLTAGPPPWRRPTRGRGAYRRTTH